MGILEWVLDNRGVLPVLPRVLLGLGKVAILVAVVKVAVLSTVVVKVAPVLEGVVVKLLRGRRASRK